MNEVKARAAFIIMRAAANSEVSPELGARISHRLMSMPHDGFQPPRFNKKIKAAWIERSQPPENL